jgi:DNA-binding beta-propeller fold protein YncE
MMIRPRRKSLPVVRLLTAFWLMGWPLHNCAAGTWAVISLPQRPGEVYGPTAVATDQAGNLYVADSGNLGNAQIQKRDSRGNWSVIATQGAGDMAADGAGNLYVADWANRIQ